MKKKEIKKSKNRCPECGSPLTFSEGCKMCPDCGWSAC